MPKKTYTDATQGEYTRLARIMEQHHPELATNGIRVFITSVRAFNSDDEPTTALKFAGGTCYAQVRVVNRERRLRIPFDAEMRVDGFLWDELTEAGRDALYDHELTHLRVVTDVYGAVIMDDDQRPKLKTVPDDIIMTGFLSVIRHYGEQALEYRSLQRSMEAASQELTAMLAETEADATPRAPRVRSQRPAAPAAA
jgi:hypothetical protein